MAACTYTHRTRGVFGLCSTSVFAQLTQPFAQRKNRCLRAPAHRRLGAPLRLHARYRSTSSACSHAKRVSTARPIERRGSGGGTHTRRICRRRLMEIKTNIAGIFQQISWAVPYELVH